MHVAFVIDFISCAQNCPSDNCKLQPGNFSGRMAPTRGYRRAIVAAAVTIIAVSVRTPTARAQPIQYTTDAPPPPKRRKVAVFYNVYARPRPHNRTCTSSKTWHKAGEPDKNCAWIGSSHNKQVTARRCRIYGASPPADSRLLAHYMTPPPEAPPVKLRRKANNDAGGAFRRWALRRGKGAPRRDPGATYCGQRPGYRCRGHGSEKRCHPDASCK